MERRGSVVISAPALHAGVLGSYWASCVPLDSDDHVNDSPV